MSAWTAAFSGVAALNLAIGLNVSSPTCVLDSGDVPTFAIAIVSLAVLFRWRVPEPVVIGCAAMTGLLLRPA